MSIQRHTLVVTDLDGTLLDHHDYSFSAAEPALRQLKLLGIPLILNSSKTAAEMLALRRALDNHEPFIVENGAGVFVPRQANGEGLEHIAFGMPREDLLERVRRLRRDHGYRFRGFADLDVPALAALTGLPPEKAAMALQRDFSEPVIWEDSEERFEAFREALRGEGIGVLRGGRFIHLAAAGDKARPLPWLRRWYAERLGGAVEVVALGDAGNDRALLEAADIPVVVRSPVHPPPEVRHPRLIHTREYGPAGWNSAMLSLLRTRERGATLISNKE